jgi:hypothetical protein
MISGRYRGGSILVPQLAKTQEAFEVAKPEVVEIAFAKLALGTGRVDLSHQHAAAAVKLAPENPACYDMLAWVEAQEDSNNASTEILEKAVRLGSKEALTYVLLAHAKGRAAALLGGIPPAEARQIVDLLKQAIGLRPKLLTAYQYLAYMLLSVESVSRQDALLVQQGRKFFPDEGGLTFVFAQIAWKCEDKEAARKLLAVALAAPGKMTSNELSEAHETETRWFFEDTMTQVSHLMEEKKARQALDLVDKLLAEKLPMTVRAGLMGPRQSIFAYARLQDAQEAADAGHADDARRFCREVMDTPKAPLESKRSAERLLKRLDQSPSDAGVLSQPES